GRVDEAAGSSLPVSSLCRGDGCVPSSRPLVDDLGAFVLCADSAAPTVPPEQFRPGVHFGLRSHPGRRRRGRLSGLLPRPQVSMTREDAPGVCFVTGRHLTLGRPLLDLTRSAIAGGCDVVQVREKDLTGGPLLGLVREIVEAAKTRPQRCVVVVNDRLDVALAARAA